MTSFLKHSTVMDKKRLRSPWPLWARQWNANDGLLKVTIWQPDYKTLPLENNITYVSYCSYYLYATYSNEGNEYRATHLPVPLIFESQSFVLRLCCCVLVRISVNKSHRFSGTKWKVSRTLTAHVVPEVHEGCYIGRRQFGSIPATAGNADLLRTVRNSFTIW